MPWLAKIQKGDQTMTVQGTQLDILRTMADIQQATSMEEIEDMEIAEELGLDIRLVRSALEALTKAGYVELKKLDTLSGMAYNAFLTNQGEAWAAESHRVF
jgi:Mn-dependent DtxR family transcriptional regulator